MKTETINGVECVLVPYNGMDYERNTAHAKLVHELGFEGGFCGACPISHTKGNFTCTCPYAMDHKDQFIYFPLKYWPLLQMRLPPGEAGKPPEKGGPT